MRGIRIGNVMLSPADDKRPREIYCYWVEGDRRWKVEPSKCLYCLQWQHRGHPPDFHLQLVKDEAELWAPFVCATLLAELQRHDPHLAARLNALELPG